MLGSMNCKFFGKSGFAYARLAIDNEESAMSTNHLLQPRQQLLGLVLPTDENCARFPH